MNPALPASAAALGLVLLAVAAPAAAYTCSNVGANARLCDVNDDGVPDVYFVFVQDEATLVLVAYKDAAVTSIGAGWVTYGTVGYHSGGVSVGCYDPGGDLDCDYASVAFGSTDAGYVDLQKFGDRVQLCRYGGLGFGCLPVL